MSIEAIKKALEGVTPGPWEAESGGGKGAWIKGYDGNWAAMSCGTDNANADANARYIAAVNPAAVTELISEIDRLQRENDDLRPYKDELLRLAEAVGEKDDPFAAWEHLEPAIARAEAAEAEVKRLQTELALSKPLYSRRQIEARVELLEAALKPVAEKYDSITPDAADVAEGFATHPDNMQDDQLALITLRIGDLRRVRTALASTGGEHHGN